MAKKKASKKKASTKKTGSKKGNNLPLLLIIGIFVIALVFYGLNETSQFVGESPSILSEKETSKSSSAPISRKKTTTIDPNASEKTITQPKTDTQNIVALDGSKESKKTNKNLPTYSEDNNYYFSSSFDFSWPAYSNKDQIVEHAYFTLSYDEKKEQAEWVAYKLTSANLSNAKYKRKNNFRSDPDVKTKSASLKDYKGSGYDRGHLAPAADFTWTEQGLDDSFFMSNMSPQNPSFNRGIWKKLEEKVRAWAKDNEVLYVVTGPIYKGGTEKIGTNNVAVPHQYFKVILELTGKEVKGIAFILNNESSKKPLSHYAMSIDKVERITGFDFYPLLPDELEKRIEKTYDYTLWED